MISVFKTRKRNILANPYPFHKQPNKILGANSNSIGFFSENQFTKLIIINKEATKFSRLDFLVNNPTQTYFPITFYIDFKKMH